MKTINFEISKRLNDLGLLDNIETEYYLMENIFGDYVLGNEISKSIFYPKGKKYKTLTLEEAIEFIKNHTSRIIPIKGKYNITEKYTSNVFEGDTFLEAIEKMLEYLLDNNLIDKK